MIETTRKVVARDFVIFQIKLLMDAAKDFVLLSLSIVAMVIDMIAGGGKRPRLFYSVLKLSERFDLWLNLNGAMERLEAGDIDEEGLFGASEAGSDSLLGKIEEVVKKSAQKKKDR